jgi:potassium efflux system protein
MKANLRGVIGPLVAVLLAAGMAPGQQPETATAPQSQPTTDTQPAAPRPALTLGDLQLRLKQVEEAPGLTEETKAQVVSLYKQAIQQLEIAEQWAAKVGQLEAARQEAPANLKAIQEELAVPLGEPVPQIPPDTTRAELEQRLRQVQSDLDAERKSLGEWERESDRRTARRKEIPELVTAVKTRLEKLTEASPSPGPEQAAEVRPAQQALTEARRLAAERELDAYASELLSYDARRELLQVRLDRATRRVAYLEKLAAAWQAVVQERARRESELALREAREQLKRAHPAIRPLAEGREQLALRARKLQDESRRLDARLSSTRAMLDTVSQDFEKIVRRVDATGLTNAIGQLLRKHRGDLPNLRPYAYSLRQLKDRISAAQLAMMEYEDRRVELVNVDEIVAEIMTAVDPGTSESKREMIRQAAEETVIALRSDLGNLLKDYDLLFEKLVDLDGQERELVDTIQRFDEYVDEKILWVKSSMLPKLADLRHGREALQWLLAPENWREAIASVVNTFRERPGSSAIFFALVLALWILSPRLAYVIRHDGENVPKPAQDSMGRTIRVLVATAGLTARWPATLWFLAWVIALPTDESEFAAAVASGLQVTAIVMLTLESLRQVARSNGLGEKHFRWNARAMGALKRHLAWLTVVLAPTFLTFATLDAQTLEASKDSLGRLTFSIAFLAIALFAHRALRPTGPMLVPALQRQADSWLYRLRHVLYALGVALPFALVIAAIVGYYYTSLYLGMRFIETVWLLLGLLVVRALVHRWLLLQLRRRALDEARQRDALRQQQAEGEAAAPAEHEAITIPEDKLELAAINKQTRQLIRVALVVVGVIAAWGIWAETLPALGIFREVTLWTMTQQASESVPATDGATQLRDYAKRVPITLANLGLAIIVTLMTIVAVRNIPGLLEVALLQRLPIDAGGRYAATTITRYCITVIGVIVAFAQIGIGWSKVQWLIAAMTVGLGFGLQEIFANLVSGLMLLFERPIRIGDTVTVADTSGTVTRIRTRATTIVGWDRKELIIPNKEFITGRVVNWTLSDSTIRIILPVGIAYGSDTQKTREVLRRVVQAHPNVLADPPARILFVAFGESSLNFELRAYVGSIDHYLSTIDELHQSIDQAFRKAAIEIAFPQRDIHVRSIRDALTLSGQQPEIIPPDDK